MSEADNTAPVIKKFEKFLEGLTFYELTVLNGMVVDRVRILQQAATLMSMSKFHCGDRVSWVGTDGTVRTGIIIRLNQKSVSVKTGNEGHWNVPPHLLKKEIEYSTQIRE